MNSQVYSQAPDKLNFSVDEQNRMPLSQSGFYTNPLNNLENDDSTTEVNLGERRAVTRDTLSKRSGKQLKPIVSEN